jgi:L-asparagine transporter-like permease
MNYQTLIGTIILSILSFIIINYLPHLILSKIVKDKTIKIINHQSLNYITIITTIVTITILNLAIITMFVRRDNAFYYYAGVLGIIILSTIKTLLDNKKNKKKLKI